MNTKIDLNDKIYAILRVVRPRTAEHAMAAAQMVCDFAGLDRNPRRATPLPMAVRQGVARYIVEHRLPPLRTGTKVRFGGSGVGTVVAVRRFNRLLVALWGEDVRREFPTQDVDVEN